MKSRQLKEIEEALEDLTGTELLELKETLEKVIQEKYKQDLGRRGGQRAKVKIPASCIVEREKQFFIKEHPLSILEMSTNGLFFKTVAMLYEDDLLSVSFRSPASGELTLVDCKVVRLKDLGDSKGTMEVAAVAVDKKTVKAYKEMLHKRSI